MTRIVNDFILELPEIIVDVDAISDDWINAHKPNKRFAVLDKIPSDPVLNKFVKSFDESLFDDRIKFMILRFDSYDEYGAHVDASRYTGINLLIRGNSQYSPIKYYLDDDLTNPVFEYQYKNYPILMTSQRYHSIKNDHESERILFTIHFKTDYTFQGIRDEWSLGNKDLFFSKTGSK
jgi:hypothetical protein